MDSLERKLGGKYPRKKARTPASPAVDFFGGRSGHAFYQPRRQLTTQSGALIRFCCIAFGDAPPWEQGCDEKELGKGIIFVKAG
jgi:hypothetical protein